MFYVLTTDNGSGRTKAAGCGVILLKGNKKTHKWQSKKADKTMQG